MSTTRSINDTGEVAGTAWTFGQENYKGWVWSPTLGMARLDPVPGYAASNAYSINNNRQVVGMSFTSGGGTTRATLWDAAGIHDLGALPGYSSSVAMDINNHGEVVGYSYTPGGGSWHATLWDANGPQALGELATYSSSRAWSINDDGAVVGSAFSWSGNETYRPCLWMPGEEAVDLGSLPGFSSSVINDISNNYQAVGTSWGIGRDSFHATVWESGSVSGLGTLAGYSSADATAVNDAGRVIGYAYSPGGTSRRAFIR
jgi:probable HAF family extracellular repeat protein